MRLLSFADCDLLTLKSRRHAGLAKYWGYLRGGRLAQHGVSTESPIVQSERKGFVPCDHEYLNFRGGKFSKSRGAAVEVPYCDSVTSVRICVLQGVRSEFANVQLDIGYWGLGVGEVFFGKQSSRGLGVGQVWLWKPGWLVGNGARRVRRQGARCVGRG
jgi:hypothetical protein